MQFERLAFDANAAIDSLRPARPFPLPLKAARDLFMPLFVLAELRLGAERSRQTSENSAMVDQLLARCRVINADTDTIPFYILVRNEFARRPRRRPPQIFAAAVFVIGAGALATMSSV